MASRRNIIDFQLIDIALIKFGEAESISLVSQMVELNVYQSLFAPCIKAELIVYDPISLFVNFPMVGEERIEVSYHPTRDEATSGDEVRTNNQTYKWNFMINRVVGISPDDKGQSQLYMIELYSYEMRDNARKRIQRAYREPYYTMVQKVLRDDLRVTNEKLRVTNFEESMGVQHVCVPNLNPYTALHWFAKRAVPVSPQHKLFFFYENFNGYNFNTLEYMFEKEKRGEEISEFIYFSDMTESLVKEALKRTNLTTKNVITAMQIHRRFNTIERIMGGLYENDYVDIDTFNRRVVSTRTELAYKTEDGKFSMNTENFIEAMKTHTSGPGTATRAHYKLSQSEGDEAGAPNNWKAKYGEGVQAQINMAQISVTAAAPGDTRVNVGDMVKLSIPEMHGYTKLDSDRYIAGKYVITDIKHMITAGMQHMMSMNLHKQSFENEIEKTMRYNLGPN